MAAWWVMNSVEGTEEATDEEERWRGNDGHLNAPLVFDASVKQVIQLGEGRGYASCRKRSGRDVGGDAGVPEEPGGGGVGRHAIAVESVDGCGTWQRGERRRGRCWWAERRSMAEVEGDCRRARV